MTCSFLGFVLFTVFSDAFVDLATVASKGTKMPRADWDFLKKQLMRIPNDELLKEFGYFSCNVGIESHTTILNIGYCFQHFYRRGIF